MVAAMMLSNDDIANLAKRDLQRYFVIA